jgi:hypothetical protein
MILAGNVACMGEQTSVYTALIEKSEGKKH